MDFRNNILFWHSDENEQHFLAQNDVIKTVLFSHAFCEQVSFSKKKYLFFTTNTIKPERKNDFKRFILTKTVFNEVGKNK